MFLCIDTDLCLNLYILFNSTKYLTKLSLLKDYTTGCCDLLFVIRGFWSFCFQLVSYAVIAFKSVSVVIVLQILSRLSESG